MINENFSDKDAIECISRLKSIVRSLDGEQGVKRIMQSVKGILCNCATVQTFKYELTPSGKNLKEVTFDDDAEPNVEIVKYYDIDCCTLSEGATRFVEDIINGFLKGDLTNTLREMFGEIKTYNQDKICATIKPLDCGDVILKVTVSESNIVDLFAYFKLVKVEREEYDNIIQEEYEQSDSEDKFAMDMNKLFRLLDKMDSKDLLDFLISIRQCLEEEDSDHCMNKMVEDFISRLKDIDKK